MQPRTFATFHRLSRLREQANADPVAFLSAHRHCWLIWEAGSWQVPSSDELTTRREPPPSADDSLASSLGASFCYELQEKAGGEPTEVRLGRDPRSELLINDATVSRQQLILTGTAGRWTARRIEKSAAAKCNGQPMGDQAVPLTSGTQMNLGQVTLTFYDPEGMLARLRADASAKKP